MGARGGVLAVRAYKCTTCGRLREERADAVRCCNEKMFQREAVQRRAKIRRALENIGRSQIEIRRGFVMATCRCSRTLCNHRATVRVSTRTMWGGPRMTRAAASKKASALARAQMSRHLDHCVR